MFSSCIKGEEGGQQTCDSTVEEQMLSVGQLGEDKRGRKRNGKETNPLLISQPGFWLGELISQEGKALSFLRCLSFDYHTGTELCCT